MEISTGTFAKWLCRQGYSVVEVNNYYWYNQGPMVYQNFPYHHINSFDSTELKEVFGETGAIALRYSTEVEQPLGKISYHVVREKPFVINEFPKKVRHDLQHGIQYAVYEPISILRLANEGWNLRLDTLIRQGREEAENQKFWERLCLSAEGLPGFEAWGALHQNKLVASILTITIDDTACILYQQSLTKHLKYGVNNALAYIYTNEILLRPGIEHIFYGLHSLDAPPSVDEFKFRMGYTAKPVRQRVVFHPLLAPLFNPFTHFTLNKLSTIWSGNPFLAKAEGMVRFYLEGKKPLEQQVWPENLANLRDVILLKQSQ